MKNTKTVEEKEVKVEPLTKEQAEELAKKLSDEGKGRYVVAAAEKGKTRLMLKDLKKDSKEPKFRMFCVTWDEVKTDGIVLARIDGFRTDKKNNVYMIAKPVLSLLDVKHLFASAVWDFVLPYEIMWQPYGTKRDVKHERFNVDAAYGKLGITRTEDEAVDVKKLWERVIKQNKFEVLAKALNAPTTYENVARAIHADFAVGQIRKNTYLYKRIEREEMDVKKLAEFCKQEHLAYVRLGLTGADNIPEEAEAVMKYYAEKKAEEKEAKKAAKAKN